MTTQEFSNSFDTLLNSYASKASYGDELSNTSVALDEYEKSVFLTKAQEMLVEELYSGKNADGESYEETERLRRSLANLNVEMEYEPLEDTSSFYPISSDSQFFQIDNDIMFITYESVLTEADECLSGKQIEVVPVRQDWYHRQHRNPFRGATNNKALRLDRSDDVIEIVYPLTISKYHIGYVRKPKPIILEDLDNLTINGSSNERGCELHEMVHRKILERAVMLALASKNLLQRNEREQ